jgi:hypothetical protein
VLRLTHPYQKAVAVWYLVDPKAWESKSGAGILSLKICRDRPARSAFSCQTFHCASVACGPSERNRRPHFQLEPHPPQPSSEPVSRNRPARAFFMAFSSRFAPSSWPILVAPRATA